MKIKNKMVESIVNAKDLTRCENPFYWYSQLDYSNATSHPEYQVLKNKVEADFKMIEEADHLMKCYYKLGVDIRETLRQHVNKNEITEKDEIMKRSEHLQWAKDRAIKIRLNSTSLHAWTSFVSDMSKHEDLKGHIALKLGAMMILSNHLETKQQFIDFIKGFN